jgi:hypothetical protein
MKSALLKKMTYGVSHSPEVVDGQQENIEDLSTPWRPRENPLGRVSSPVEALDHKEPPALLRFGDRRQHSLR